jgi:peptide/nickel transport system permease protein
VSALGRSLTEGEVVEGERVDALTTAGALMDRRPRRFSRFLRRWLRGARPILGLIILLVILGSALFAPLLTSYSPVQTDFSSVRQAPSAAHWFGTDSLGRDVFSRVLYGGRVSLLAGVIPILIAGVLGGLGGLLAGYLGGLPEQTFMRLADVMLAFPPLVLALSIVYSLGPDFHNALIAIGITMIPEYVRVVRAQALSLKEQEFIEASRALGAGSWRIMLIHIAPNLAAPVLVLLTIGAGRAILIEAGLSYLGLGVQPPDPSWGSMVQNGYAYLDQAPWMAIFPGLVIVLTVLGINFLGDSLRDVLDPRLRRR